jgi:hypothetical protein
MRPALQAESRQKYGVLRRFVAPARSANRSAGDFFSPFVANLCALAPRRFGKSTPCVPLHFPVFDGTFCTIGRLKDL